MRRQVVLFSVMLLMAALLGPPAASGQNPFKLKPGAEGKICLGCHPDFEEKLKSKFVHTPVKTEECSGCHNPHTSRHGKLLFASPSKICFKCHETIIPEKAVSSHKIAVAGECVKCHDPHASDNKGNLRQAGNALCTGCHKDVADALTKVKFGHMPVGDSCLNCHDPHASTAAPHLLRKPVPTLCLDCHDPKAQNFVRRHASYPVATANCTSCHSPHGSNTAGILYDTVHAPVASLRCGQCHEAPTSPAPFQTRRPGLELCRGCHGPMMNDLLSRNRIHWPLVDKTGCLNCHEPHAARMPKLLNQDLNGLCGRCHVDTLDKQVKLAEKEKQENLAAKGQVIKGAITHKPIQEGACTACHLPHSSDRVYLMKPGSTIDVCGTCHDWLKHSSHPMGEKLVDPRNRNLRVDCLSCHWSHGTGYRYLLPYPTVTDLCVQCHKQFRR